jgi:glutaredoxin
VIHRTLALTALLFACSPASEDAAPPDPAPAVHPAQPAPPPAPAPPKPVRERAPRRRSEGLRAGNGYYQYVDESGHVRFAASLEDIPETQRATAGHISVAAPEPRIVSSVERAEEPRAAVSANASAAEVTLYETASCPYCKQAAAYMDSVGQSYTKKDIEEDPAAHDELLSLTGGRSGVPVIVVGDKWMQGWNRQKLEQLLAQAH